MHYDVKMKLNKIDTQQYKNLLIPEIDWKLNEGMELFVKMVASPRLKNSLGFETSQRSIDDIRPLVVTPDTDPSACITVVGNNVTLPSDYWHFIKADVIMSKGECKDVKARFYPRQHDDEFEESPFDKSNFEWRTVNGVFNENGVKLYTDGTFNISSFCLSYLKKLTYIHNAKDFRGTQYRLPSGTLLTGSVNCELPEHTHREIVDIAVLLITGELQMPDYQIKLNKLNLNNLK